MFRTDGVLCLFFLQLIISSMVNIVNMCLDFEIHDNSPLTVQENTRINITFSLINKGCFEKKLSNIEIIISKRDKLYGSYIPQCTIWQKGNACNDPTVYDNISCGCMKSPTERFSYLFTLKATRLDNTTWRWSIPDGRAKEVIIDIIVLYPPVIKRLALDNVENTGPLIVPKGKSVNINCSWENGNPPKTASLLNNNKHLLNESNNLVIYYQYLASRCPDFNVVRCEAPNSSVNKSTTLLTKCPPILTHLARNHTNRAGQNVSLVFSLRTHIQHVDECTLRQTSTSTQDSTYTLNCAIGETTHSFLGHKCRCSMNGSLPELTLIVQLSEINQDFDGPWRLNVRNDAGRDHLDIFLTVLSDVTAGNIRQSAASDNEPGRISVIILSIITVVAVVITVIVIVRQKIKKDNIQRELVIASRSISEGKQKLADTSGNTSANVPPVQQNGISDSSTHDCKSCENPSTQNEGQCVRCSCQRTEVMHLVFYQAPPFDQQRPSTPTYSSLDPVKCLQPLDYRQYSTVAERRQKGYLTPCSHEQTSQAEGHYLKHQQDAAIACDKDVNYPTLKKIVGQQSMKTAAASIQENEAETDADAHYLTID